MLITSKYPKYCTTDYTQILKNSDVNSAAYFSLLAQLWIKAACLVTAYLLLWTRGTEML